MRIAAFLFCTFFLVACFNTRDVEPPATGSSDWVSPTDYTILLNNLKLSISQKNTQNYLRCFNDDSLRFVPATTTRSGNEILWDSWNIADELTWFDNVINKLAIVNGNYLELEQVDLQSFSTDSVKYIGNYTMQLNHSDTTLTTHFRGQVEFVCKVNEYNEWEIHRWSDFETAPDSSWSSLKLEYAQ